uniref:Syntaxin binding protein 3 n=1 Tax=Electrophorus electricus TaxID=8005 RepID=A0A4W4E4A6_ELEEL
MATGSDYGLKKIVWQKLKDTIIADCRKTDVWKILILDNFTTCLLSSCCNMTDLMNEGITMLSVVNAFFLHCPFCGFLKPKYKAAYVYFTDYCPDELFNRIKLCAKYIKVCKEINISFLPLEAQVFTCNNPAAFSSIYSPHSQDRNQTLEALADQIVTLCATLDEYPGVRYKKDSSKDYAKFLAELVDKKLERHYRLDDDNKKKEKTSAQLIIVDRGFDPVSPILHELTYQAMAYDLMDIKNDTYKYKGKDGSQKEALLNEADELWLKYDCFSAPPPQKTIHLSLAEDCMTKFQESVEKLCKAEQDLAMGLDVEGQKVRDPMRTLLPILLNPHSTPDKIRAVLLYIFSLNGTTEENLTKLIQHVKIENESEYITNWKELGVPIIMSLFSSRKSSRRDRSQEEMYNLSRWTPIIKDVMEDVVGNKLDTSVWPHQSECPSAWNGSRAVSARQKPKPSSLDDYRSGLRLIIFILGGVCYSEMRCAYEVTQATKTCEVIVGSSHILTPASLLEDIRDLSKMPMQSFTIEEETS